MNLLFNLKICFGVILIFISYSKSFPQKIKRSTGTYQIKWESNQTRDEAYRVVEQQAKIDAIINAFGQYVEQETNLTVASGKSIFNIIGATKVKGEWMETLDKKINEETQEVKGEYGVRQEIWISCEIKGKIKEATPKANIEVYTLGYPNKASKTETYYSGDSLYLYFKSPVDGYLSVYLDDGKNINRILPYDYSSDSHVEVNADTEYLLFSEDHNYFNDPKRKIDKLELFTPLESELNTLHVIFSENNYYKPGLNVSKKDKYKNTIPKTLARKDFEEWLADNKTSLNDFQDYQININISGEK